MANAAQRLCKHVSGRHVLHAFLHRFSHLQAEKSGFAIQILDMPPVGEEPQAVGKRKFLFGTRDAQEAIKSVLLRLLHTDGVSEFAWEVGDYQVRPFVTAFSR